MGTADASHITLQNRQINGDTAGGVTAYDGKTVALDVGLLKYAYQQNPKMAVKAYFVHELAHVWDISSGGFDPSIPTAGGNLSKGMTAAGVTERDNPNPAQYHLKDNQKEVWAEAVAAYVYPDFDDYKPYRADYQGGYPYSPNPMRQSYA